MNWKSFFLGVGVGIVTGFAAKELLAENSCVSSEKVLAHVKSEFKKEAPISGSWIHMKTEPYEKNQLHYNVYRGGISRTVNEEAEQYEFVADAKTGTILDIYPIT
ncbi:hypothetical protein CVD25_07220 [Bacillus canaveralius]|uniref:PepSY domain-containing protein n=1 Tax=Bacillus canaveralius TaxID=1403243 RepID=A0A2N5GHF9_9BACI|nr:MULTISPECIES: PepSY domain-containing protein [Bacillus]PLR80160.1 hypothetical protein CU635_19315 [Bacillus canaveralius]PLR83828.1 hypothetical protein CVD23_13175 [Bacillus sp. V33-4]PLR98697.1 hypothetical protein CVD25_07220 [Bacillus canaveralius]RSK48199.1 hypothetical protein EJA13_17065 [Bacillus canaveralius]